MGAGNWGKNLIRNFFELNALKVICDKNEAVIKTNAETLSFM